MVNKKKQKKPSYMIISIKMERELYRKLRQKAERNAGGNLSAWIRYAGLKYSVKKGEHVPRPKLGCAAGAR